MTGREFTEESYRLAGPVGKPVLSVKGLTLRGCYADVSFDLSPGEILGITGLLGSGRTELVETIFGISKPDGGTIEIEGRPARISSVKAAIRRGIGYVPSDRLTEGLFQPQTIERNIVVAVLARLSSRLGFLKTKAVAETTARWISELSIATRDPSLPVRTLSGGNQQKVVLARWLANDLKVLILNGPTMGVDIGSKYDIHALMRRLAASGLAIIVVSDDLPEVLACTSRILVMRDGALVQELDPGIDDGIEARRAVHRRGVGREVAKVINPRRLLGRSEPWVLASIVVLSLLIQARSGQFFTGNNLVDLVQAMIVPGLFSVGCMMVIVSGGIDVSFTAVASLAMYVTDRVLLSSHYAGSVLLAYAMSAGLGLVMGALNGLLIAYLRLPTLVVTLGTASLFTGLMFGAFSASASAVPPAIVAHSKEILFTAVNPQLGLTSNMPSQVLILVGVFALAFLLLRYTMVGRGIYAIGGDETAAERAGFNVRAIKMFLYCLVGVLAGITGIARISMIAYADPSTVLGMELTVIAAVVLGGTRVTGGVGTLTGTALGVALMIILANSLILMGIPTYWTRVFTGAVIIIGTGVTARQIGTKRRRERGPAREPQEAP